MNLPTVWLGARAGPLPGHTSLPQHQGEAARQHPGLDPSSSPLQLALCYPSQGQGATGSSRWKDRPLQGGMASRSRDTPDFWGAGRVPWNRDAHVLPSRGHS